MVSSPASTSIGVSTTDLPRPLRSWISNRRIVASPPATAIWEPSWLKSSVNTPLLRPATVPMTLLPFVRSKILASFDPLPPAAIIDASLLNCAAYSMQSSPWIALWCHGTLSISLPVVKSQIWRGAFGLQDPVRILLSCTSTASPQMKGPKMLRTECSTRTSQI